MCVHTFRKVHVYMYVLQHVTHVYSTVVLVLQLHVLTFPAGHVWGTCSWLRRSAISVHDKRNVRRHRNQTRARNEDLDLILFSVGLNFFAICFVPTPISALAIFATVLHCFASATFAEFGKR
jgi:hypothetical protein